MAVLIAQGADFDKVRASFVEPSAKLHRIVTTKSGLRSVAHRAFRPLFGFPMVSRKTLSEAITEILSAGGIEPTLTIGELKVPTIIMIGDLGKKRAYAAPTSMSVLEALVLSASVPILFSIPRKGTPDPSLMDGAFLDNLPANELLNGVDQFGEVLAISFTSQPGSNNYESHPLGTGRYIGDIWEAAQAQRTDLTKELVFSTHVLELDDSLRAVDFHRMIEPGMFDYYFNSMTAAAAWLEDFNALTPVRPQVGSRSSGRFGAARQRLSGIQRDAQRLWEENISKGREMAESLDLLVYMRSARASLDETKLIELIRNVGDEPLAGTRMDFLSYEDNGEYVSIGVEDAAGAPIPSVVLPLDLTNGRSYLILYGRPLPPGECYRVVKTERAEGFMNPLRNSGSDTLSVFGIDGHSQCKRASITLFVPREYPALNVEDQVGREDFEPAPTETAILPAHLAEAALTHYHRVSSGSGPIRGIALAFTVR